MDAYEKLKGINTNEILSEDKYNSLQTEFQNEWLAHVRFGENLERHRKPMTYMNEVSRLLETPLREIQYRPEMSHTEPKMHTYVPHMVTDTWERDNTLNSEYEAILKYCEKHKKDPNTILAHMAEYRGLQKLYEKIRLEAYQIENKSMTKNYVIERREYHEDKPYLKVFLKGDADFGSVVAHLEALHSVKRVNITDQRSGKRDLTVYPEKAYDIAEVEQEMDLALKNYLEGRPADPIFVTETISSISNKAYAEIIDHIVRVGKNLEGFKELNTKFDEERYRDYFIPYLNAISKSHSAKGEVFNRKGKTDILVFDNDGNNIFIAECKIWNGEAYLLKAVDQLLENYVNWRDEKTAVIIFNRDNKKFSEIIDTATKAIENHPLCVKSLGKGSDVSYSYLFNHPDDDKRSIKLELILFNCA